MNDKEKFEEETLAEFMEMTGIPKEKIKRYGKCHSIKFKTLGETYEYEFKTSGLVVELYVSLLPVLYFPKKHHDISEPVLSHSEISGLIYVYFGGEKYEITKYAIEAVEAIKALEQEPRKGHWVQITPAKIYECSECGQSVMTNDIEVYHFCHGCGAEMTIKEFKNDALQIVPWKDCECVEFRYQNEYGKKTFRIISLGMLFLNGNKREDVNKFVFDMIDDMRRELDEQSLDRRC